MSLRTRAATKPMLVLDVVVDKERVGGSGDGPARVSQDGTEISLSSEVSMSLGEVRAQMRHFRGWEEPACLSY